MPRKKKGACIAYDAAVGEIENGCVRDATEAWVFYPAVESALFRDRDAASANAPGQRAITKVEDQQPETERDQRRRRTVATHVRGNETGRHQKSRHRLETHLSQRQLVV